MGRVNLTGITEGPGGWQAEVGNRIGPYQAGRGLARAALHLAREIGIDRLEARVARWHAASIRVLGANGFVPTGRVLRDAELLGQPLPLLYYQPDL